MCSCYHINIMHVRLLSVVISSIDITENIPKEDDKFTYREVETSTENP